MDDKSVILNFIKKHNVGVIATVDEKSNPESAVMEFGETETFELIFDAYSTSRKVKNIKQNNNVCFAIGGDEKETVQYEGKAFELAGEELIKYQEIYFKKIPEARKWSKEPEIVFFKVSPSWIRYTDLSKYPWNIKEIKF